MPAGLQVIGSHGIIQVDENFSNLAYRGSGSFSGSLTLSGLNFPVLAFRPGNVQGTSISRIVAGGGGNFTWHFTGSGSGNYWLFDIPEQSGSFGLQVFRADGSLAFDSGRRYMKVVSGFYDFGNHNSGTNNTGASDSGSVAIVQAAPPNWRTGGDPNNDLRGVYGLRSSGGAWESVHITNQSLVKNGLTLGAHAGKFFLVDVAGY